MIHAPYTTWIESRISGSGWLCLGTITGNPDAKPPMVQHWYQWPAQKAQALEDVSTWIDDIYHVLQKPAQLATLLLVTSGALLYNECYTSDMILRAQNPALMADG